MNTNDEANHTIVCNVPNKQFTVSRFYARLKTGAASEMFLVSDSWDESNLSVAVRWGVR